MTLSIVGVAIALLAAVVTIIGSFRSTPLLSKSKSNNKAMLNALILYFERQGLLYENLSKNGLSDSSSKSRFEDMVEKCGTVKNMLIMRIDSESEHSSNVASSRLWQFISFCLVIVSVVFQVAALFS